MYRYSKHNLPRSGFTLLELLMVVSIIGILITLSAIVMRGMLGSAEEEATSATIQKLNRLLEQRIDGFDRAFSGARRTTYISATNALLAGQGIYGVREEVVATLARKAAIRFEFPQRIEDLTIGSVDGDSNGNIDADNNGNGMPDSVEKAVAIPSAREELRRLDPTGADPSDAAIQSLVDSRWALHMANRTAVFPLHPVDKTESSELLYFTLVASGSFGSGAVDVDRFTNAEVKDTDSDGLPEFVDAWGEPLRFYRWPTRLIDTNPVVPFQPNLLTEDATDIDLSPDNNDADGLREITSLERQVANILLKGLPPGPSGLPNGALPRDLLLTDPDDPVGRLYSELERLDGSNGTPVFANEFNEAKYHTPDTFHSPLILSAGPDGVVGLFEPIDTASLGNLAAYDTTLSNSNIIDAISDNVTSRNKRIGGRN